jgi:hypothetical protein
MGRLTNGVLARGSRPLGTPWAIDCRVLSTGEISHASRFGWRKRLSKGRTLAAKIGRTRFSPLVPAGGKPKRTTTAHVVTCGISGRQGQRFLLDATLVAHTDETGTRPDSGDAKQDLPICGRKRPAKFSRKHFVMRLMFFRTHGSCVSVRTGHSNPNHEEPNDARELRRPDEQGG